MSIFYTGIKSPDNMTRAEKIKRIKSFETDEEASSFWIRYGLAGISKKSFWKARGYE